MKASDIHFGLFEKTEREDSAPTHIESVEYDVTFHGLLVSTKMIQKFTNRSETPVELEYKYRSDYSPHKMEVTLFDPETGEKEVLFAKIHTKEKALEKYDDAISSGKGGVLMEKDEDSPNLYSLSLGNMKPKMEITIRTDLVSTSTLETDDEDPDKLNFLYSIPSLTPSVQNQDHGKTMMVNINAVNAQSVTCSSHNDALSNISPGKWVTKEKMSVTEEFEITVSYTEYPFSCFTVTPTSFEKFKYAGILSLFPNFAAQAPGGYELILIIDCSGSMSGARMKCAVQALRLFMQSLDTDRKIKYNIIRFGSKYRKLFPKSVRLRDDENLRKAQKFVESTRSNMGGTNMLKPIQSIFGIANDSEGSDESEREEILKRYVEQKVCTYKLTKKNFCFQSWFFCGQCNMTGNTGCCEACKESCHSGHEGVVEANKSPSRFYCDCGCGNSKCEAMRNTFNPNIVSKMDVSQKEEEEEGEGEADNYTKQLFLFTDGEDEFPRQIEALVRQKHREMGVRVFSFGIGRGINPTFLQNCADFTQGSACFIEDIKEEMKTQVLRQLSNAFRTSIDEIRVKKGLLQDDKMILNDNILRVCSGQKDDEDGSSVIPLLFNGRSYHEYYFLEDLPSVIEVEYNFLGIKCDESVVITTLLEDKQQEQSCDDEDCRLSSVEVRVANEFVNFYQKKKKDHQKMIEQLGLHFHLPTDYTSFYLESQNPGKEKKIVSEMKMEQVQILNNDNNNMRGIEENGKSVNFNLHRIRSTTSSTKSNPDIDWNMVISDLGGDVIVDDIPSPCNYPSDDEDYERVPIFDSSLIPPAGIVDKEMDDLFADIDDMVKEVNEEECLQALQPPEEEPVVCKIEKEEEEIITEKEVLKSEPRKEESVRKPMLEPMEKKNKKKKDSKKKKKMDMFGEDVDEKEEECDAVSGVTSSEKLPVAKQNVHGAVSNENLSQLLLLCDMKGIWPVTPHILQLIGFPSKEMFIETTKPDIMNNQSDNQKKYSSDLKLWLTAVILAILNKFYKKKRSEWSLIVKKSRKKLNASDFGVGIITDAKRIVNSF